MIALALSATTSFWLIAIGALAFTIAFTGMMPLTETIAMAGVRASGLDYGRMRLWGSATFIAASFIGGTVIDHYGAQSGIWLLVGASAIVLAASLILPNPKATIAPETQTSDQPAPWPAPTPANLNRSTLQSGPRLLHSKTFLIFIVASGLAQASHATYYTFGTLDWLDQGISPVWIGALWVIGVLAEIALFSYSNAISKVFGPVELLATGALAGVARWLIMAFDPPLALLFPLQFLHALTYGATHLGAIHFIARAIPEKRMATAQAFYGATGNGIAMGCATLIAGSLYVWAGSASYIAMSGISLLALIAAVTLASMWSGQQLRD